MSSLELAKSVPISLKETWSATSKIGWEIMCHILYQAVKECRMRNYRNGECDSHGGSSDSEDWEDDHSEEGGYDFSKEEDEDGDHDNSDSEEDDDVESEEEEDEDTRVEEDGINEEQDDISGEDFRVSEEKKDNDRIMVDLDARNLEYLDDLATRLQEESISEHESSCCTPVETSVNDYDEYQPTYTSHDGWCYEAGAYFGHNKYLGHIMAAIQVELLTYRRIRVTDPWLSKRFSMDELLQNLESGSRVSIELVRTGIMTPYCSCGAFRGLVSSDFPKRVEVTKKQISNMDWEDEHAHGIPPPPTFVDAIEASMLHYPIAQESLLKKLTATYTNINSRAVAGFLEAATEPSFAQA
jgi:hypothetical protein